MEIVGAAPPSVDQIRERHERLLSRLRSAAAEHGHEPDRLRVVAVTKTHSIGVVRAAIDAGLTRLGESRIQEAEPKVAAAPEAEWHFIGRLQSNKVRRAIRAMRVIHSIDSVELLRRADAIAAEEAMEPQVLLQVNVSGETAKAGMETAELAEVVAPETVSLVGLMTIAPMGAVAGEARAIFRRLREERDRLEQRLGIGLPELSMGMSADAEAAAAEGATLVRIGTALFGPREPTLVSSDP